MKTITKADIASKISDQIGLSVSLCEDIISCVINKIIDSAESGKQVHIKNFGSFETFEKKPRPGRDIHKNKSVVIESKRVMRFSASRKLRNLVNQ